MLPMVLSDSLAALRCWAASTRLVVAAGGTYLASQAAIAAILAPLGLVDFIRAQTSPSAETVAGLFAQWKSAGLMGRYEGHFALDFIHPLWYALFLSLLMGRAFNRLGLPARYNAFLALPFLAALFDEIENVFHVAFLASLSSLTPVTAAMGASASCAKWGLSLLCIAIIGALALKALMVRRDQ